MKNEKLNMQKRPSGVMTLLILIFLFKFLFVIK